MCVSHTRTHSRIHDYPPKKKLLKFQRIQIFFQSEIVDILIAFGLTIFLTIVRTVDRLQRHLVETDID